MSFWFSLFLRSNTLIASRFWLLWWNIKACFLSHAKASALPGWHLWTLLKVGLIKLKESKKQSVMYSDKSHIWNLYIPFYWCPKCYLGDVYVPLWVKKGSLSFPQDPDTPVIMVGPGTGVAPFRSAIQERAAQGKMGEFLGFCSFFRNENDQTCFLLKKYLWAFSSKGLMYSALFVQNGNNQDMGPIF